MSILSRQDYREILRDELVSRQRKNLNYSQRAFARDLRIGPNRLSEILNEKQGLSAAYAKQIATRLGYRSDEVEYFCELVKERHARNARDKATAKSRLACLREKIHYHEVSLDAFRIISDWYHLAIVELTKTAGFEPHAKWIANRLDIAESDAKAALARLERVGLLERIDGELSVSRADNVLPSGIPSDSIKKFHEGLLARASRALFTQSLDEREFSSTMLAIEKNAVPEVKRRMGEFWKGIDKDFGGRPGATELYALGMQFFALTEGDDV